MNTKHILIAALLAGAFAPALASAAADSAGEAIALRFDAVDADADDTGGPGERAREVIRERFVFNGPEGAAMHGFEQGAFNGPMMFMHGKAIKNAPYSAEVVSEQVQNLADGNQIVNRSTSMSYRDSAGRTRQEVRNASGAVRSITIHDPADGSTYMLNPESHSATKIGPHREMARIAGDKAREEIEKARKEIEKARKEGGRAAQEEIIVKRIDRSEGGVNQRVRENVRIHVIKEMAEGRAMAGLERLERIGPMIAGAFGDMKWSGKAATKDLGTKEIDGVKAQGKLRSYEIPAGEVGNRNPIVVSNETWYSPELQVTLLSKHSDPRSGERIYRLSGLKRDEPAPALFTVPADYTVTDVMAMAKKMEAKK